MPFVKKDIIQKDLCYHCGDTCNFNIVHFDDKSFCCNGCKSIYEILSSNQLCDYYTYSKHAGIKKGDQIFDGRFDYLDDEEIVASLIQFKDNNIVHISLYIPSIHCSSCLWLLENLYKFNDGILENKTDFIQKELHLIYDQSQITLRQLVELLFSIGYEPYFDIRDKKEDELKINRKAILRIGIAGFCFANIMMISLPHYLAFNFKLDNNIATILNYLTILLSIPVLFYCAYPFFSLAYQGLKRNIINIEVPVALAILVTFCRSLYEIILQNNSGYLDSMSGIIFFMLIGRWLQEKTFSTIKFDRNYNSYFPISIRVKGENGFQYKSLDKVEVNDIITIRHNEIIPVDALLLSGLALFDYSFINGESIPKQILKGEIAYAGARQLGANIELAVVKNAKQSYLTKLWNEYNNEEKPNTLNNIYDNIGKYFTIVVMSLALSAFIYWWANNNSYNAWTAFTTVLIVACPCALLLTKDLTYGNILRILGINNFYIKNVNVLLKLQDITHIVFDKTGTLSYNNIEDITYKGEKLDIHTKQLLASVLNNSNHPLSKSIVKHLNIQDLTPCEDIKSTAGYGLEAWIDDKYFKIGSGKFLGISDSNNITKVYVAIDKHIIGDFSIKNKYRGGVIKFLEQLKQKYKISVLSGDNDADKSLFTNFIPSENLVFNASPIDKKEYIESLQKKGEIILMVGDGLNDTLALKASDVGIAITENENNFSPESDAILHAKRLFDIERFLDITKKGKYIVFMTFLLSVIYNFIGLYFSLSGQLKPVIAAILMPLSTITIIFITFGSTQIISKKMNFKNH